MTNAAMPAPRPESALANVSEDAARLISASISPNTRRAYDGALRRLREDLAGETLSDTLLADYLSRMHEQGLAPASASMTVAAVRFSAKLAGAPDPVGPMARRTLAGIRRAGKDRGRGQVAGLRWSQADSVATLSAADGSTAGLRDAAIVATMSDAMLRVSETRALDIADLEAQPDGTGRLTVRSSKTDPEGAGAVLFLGAPTMDRVRAWIDRAGLTEGPLFRRMKRGGIVSDYRLSCVSLRKIVRMRAKALGLTGRLSGHSARVGSAQSLVSRGATLPEAQVAGRWKSPRMVAVYARGELAGRGAVARLRYTM